MSVAHEDTMTVLSRLKFKHWELIKAAEAVLVAMATDPLSVDPEDKCVFDELRWDERKIARELGRVQALHKWQPKAGSNVEFAESVEMHAALSKSVPKKVSELQSKRDEIQAKIDEENAKLSQAQRRLDGFDHARKMLRDLVPTFIRKKYDDELAAIRSSDSANRMRELQSRRTMIHGVLEKLSQVDAHNVAQIRLHCQSVGLADIVPPPSPNFEQNRHINEVLWHAYLNQLRDELPTLEAELAELEQFIDEELAAAESILDYYIQGGK
jgi:DNA repair exonuclease SbcCD ATPase subunit